MLKGFESASEIQSIGDSRRKASQQSPSSVRRSLLVGNQSFAVKFFIVSSGLGIFWYGAACYTVVMLPNKDEGISNLANLATTAGVLLALGALFFAALGGLFAARQLRHTKVIARHEFLLKFYEMVQKHNDVDVCLSGDGWPNGRQGPETPEEWHKVYRYMGLLATVYDFIQANIFDPEQADENYSHRIVRILSNKLIYEKELVECKCEWSKFHLLLDTLRGRPKFAMLMAKRSAA